MTQSNPFHTLVDASIQGIVIHRDFRPLFANRAYAELYGYATAEEVLQLSSLMPLVSGVDQDRARSNYDHIIRGDRKFHRNRIRSVRKDGRPIIVDMVERPVVWEGEPASLCTLVDVTDMVNAQEKLQEALAETASRFVALLDAVPIGVALFDEERRLVAYNQLYADTMRVPATVLDGRPSLRELLAAKRDCGAYGGEDMEALLERTIRRWDAGDLNEEMAFEDGRIIEVAGTRRPGEGWLFVYKDITERKRLETDLFRLATTDPLTGVANRRALIDRCDHELRRARRSGSPLSVLLFDIDRFKAINDGYGHGIGDAALIALAQTCRINLRATDLFGRLGGEEFCAVLPDTPLEGAIRVAENLRQRTAEIRVPVPGSELTFTVSIGVAVMNRSDEGLDHLLHRADEALYRAKREGRNRVVPAVVTAAA